jgi:rare lipoprotein A
VTLVLLLAAVAAACAGGNGEGAGRREGAVLKTERGKASWYGDRFHGRMTASGERFDQGDMTAAHRKLPFGARVRVKNERNGRSVVVRINDRGPYGPGRIIDVSRAAAEKLDMIRAGVVPVTVEVLELPPPRERRRR